jgi:hypothetical protein
MQGLAVLEQGQMFPCMSGKCMRGEFDGNEDQRGGYAVWTPLKRSDTVTEDLAHGKIGGCPVCVYGTGRDCRVATEMDIVSGQSCCCHATGCGAVLYRMLTRGRAVNRRPREDACACSQREPWRVRGRATM